MMNPAAAPHSNPRLPTSIKRYLPIFRTIIALFVALTVLYTGWKISDQLKTSGFDSRKINWGWISAAVVSYVSAMTLSWMFWHRVLLAIGQRAPLGKTLLAFFASQLGKYVPGKAMVVVIRTDMIRGLSTSVRLGGVDSQQEFNTIQTGPAAASVFVETLTWLFVGSALGCLLLMIQFREQRWLLIAAALVTIVAGGLTAPPVFQAIARRLGVGRGNDFGKTADALLAGLNWPTMIFGWLVMTLGWCLNGLSLWLVLYGMGDTGIKIEDYPLTLTCVCHATVAGFVSLLPGGIGARELVLIPLLGARFGSVHAVIAAILIRLVWLGAELLTSGIIYFMFRGRR